jgi:protein ImuB
MKRRFVSIWFPDLLTDWQLIRRPELKEVPFVFAAPDRGRMTIIAASPLARVEGIEVGMRVADAKAICAGLEVLDDKPGRAARLLKGLGEWCLRFSPVVMVDEYSWDGLFMDVSGCTHLWGGERNYIKDIVSRVKNQGYTVRLSLADTPGAAWGNARFGKKSPLIAPAAHTEALLPLPPEALRLPAGVLGRLHKLGFYQIRSLVGMPRSVLRRRFGEEFLMRLGQALGTELEPLRPLQEPVHYQERLPCLEPIRTRVAIEMAIERLLQGLCMQLQRDGLGLRKAALACYRIDGKIIRMEMGTNAPSHHVGHLFRLFQLKIDQIRPALGIELFVLEALKVEELRPGQELLWAGKRGLNDKSLVQLLDRIAGKVGSGAIHRYFPAAHYWPERSIKVSSSLDEKPEVDWRMAIARPTELLKKPEPIEVMALIPDNPPRFFVYKQVKHIIAKADGPERIEREWWLDAGEHRDYYQVEDEQGQRYWLFRSGHYGDDHRYQWFLHGFFA